MTGARVSASDLAALPNPLAIPCGGVAQGAITPPPSKSVSHRYLNLSLLSPGSTRIHRLLVAEDLDHFLVAAETAGFAVERSGDSLTIAGPGRDALPLTTERRIYCGNAGTMYRFAIATMTALPGLWLVDGTSRLRQRPVSPLVDALRQLGAEIEYRANAGFAPIAIRGETLEGGRCSLDASQSSQYLSAILMAATRARRPVEVEVRGLTSEPYVAVTLDALAAFGLGDCVTRRHGASGRQVFEIVPRQRPSSTLEITVEGDFSAAAYPAAAAAITGGRVTLRGLNRSSSQGDRGFLEVLSRLGAEVEWLGKHDVSQDGDQVVVSGENGLRPLDIDLSTMPDQVPTLAAVAVFCSGTTSIRNVPHLRFKESDRLSAMSSELTRAGVEVVEHQDGLEIVGRPQWREQRPVDRLGKQASENLPAAVIDPHDDHRIAMSLALVGLRRPGVSIASPGVVAKSYPGFWSDLFAMVAQG